MTAIGVPMAKGELGALRAAHREAARAIGMNVKRRRQHAGLGGVRRTARRRPPGQPARAAALPMGAERRHRRAEDPDTGPRPVPKMPPPSPSLAAGSSPGRRRLLPFNGRGGVADEMSRGFPTMSR